MRALMAAVVCLAVLAAGGAGASVLGPGWEDEGQRIANGFYWNPEVVRLDDGTYRMYVEDHGQSVYDSNGTVVLSSPDGMDWTYVGPTNMGNHPAVVRLPEGGWRIYFQQMDPMNQTSGVGSAISQDGLFFQPEDGLRLVSDLGLEGAGIRHPCVVALPQGGFRMYYDTAVDEAFIRIWSAVSEDGLTFTREGLNIDITPLREWPQNFYAHASKPEVLLGADGAWTMYFNCSPLIGSVFGGIGIHKATSPDGTTWTVEMEPEIAGQNYPDGNFYSPFDCSVQVVEQDGVSQTRIWYSLFFSPDAGLVGQYSGIYSARRLGTD